MKTVELSKSGALRLRNSENQLYPQDIEKKASFVPGEWVVLFDIKNENKYTAYINTFVDTGPIIHLVCFGVVRDIKVYLEEKITQAIKLRALFKNYTTNARLVYGYQDGLPGLIIDGYANAIIIQITTAGMDKYRYEIERIVLENIDLPVIFLDNEQMRKREILPMHPKNTFARDLQIEENDITYQLPQNYWQKIGYYYDHRENRKYLSQIIKSMNKEFKLGLDLFCYIGSWAQNMLQAGVLEVDLVDQAPMAEVIQKNSKDSIHFFHADCFTFLENKISEQKKYDVVVCDPPAFTKSLAKKMNALAGYQKLHNMIFKILNPYSLAVFASCTHYVSEEEFEETIIKAASKNGRRIQLLYSGIQGHDHPITSKKDQANYIKALIYLVE